MSVDPRRLLLSLIPSGIGFGFFVDGKKQERGQLGAAGVDGVF